MANSGRNVAQQLIASHLVEGKMTPGAEIALAVDQTLTQDATGTLVMLELEALGLDRVRTEVSVQFVDHNLLQADSKNREDHLFPRSACRRFGLWYSKPGNGVTGVITDPRDLPVSYPRLELPASTGVNTAMLVAPAPPAGARQQELVKGPNIATLPEFDPLPDRLDATVELKAADNISSDEILPAGAEVLPLRSNIPAISRFAFRQLDRDYADRVAAMDGPHLVVAGENYGQDPGDYDGIGQGDVLAFSGLRARLSSGEPVTASRGDREVRLAHDLSERQVAMVLAGGRIPLNRKAS